MSTRLYTVIGGSGFVGRYVVQRLARAGHRVRVGVRRPHEALFLKPLGDVGQIHLVQANIRHEGSLAAAVDGADGVVNLVGILAEGGKQKFQALQAEGAGRLASLAKQAGAQSFVQVSAIGADADSRAGYARSKAEGERRVREAFPEATILRPSLVFGPEDQFFNRFAGMIRAFPMVPLIAGDTRFQPVFVGDVANAVVRALDPAAGAQGQLYELGGPRIYSFKELMQFIMETIQVKKPFLPIPLDIAKLQAAVLQILPNPPMTVGQMIMLEEDNIVAEDARTLNTLGLEAQSVESIVPGYLVHFRPQGQFAENG